MSKRAKAYVAATILLGFAALFYGLRDWALPNPTAFLVYLTIGAFASRFKVSLPGINATMSVNFLFLLIGIVELNLPALQVMGCVTVLVQCYWKPKTRPRLIQVLFNIASMATALTASSIALSTLKGPHVALAWPLALALMASTFFFLNTVPVSLVIALTEDKSPLKVWRECYFWSFPYYLVGAATAGLMNFLNRSVSWQASLLIVPVIYWIYRSYRLYIARLEIEKNHAESMTALHLRTIEALALAIEAKDQTTHSHLRRVRVYALEIGKELGLDELQLDALRAAALLHDIGKLAVPEHIISKPGKLTPEEFEKMKIHPTVGAQILERVQFPYPVVPIVLTHHEKWDGTGYPRGLKGEEIPLGARILSAVDCLDALASHRQYRRAYPLSEAMAMVEADAGKSFDPRVVDILKRRYVELERLAHAQTAELPKLSTDLRIDKGNSPAAGFENIERKEPTNGAEENSGDFLSRIAAARQEGQVLFELAQDLGNSLSLDETLSVLSVRLKKMIPFDSFAIYIRKDDLLVPEFISGDDFRLFSSLRIPLGEGISGWVAQTGKPIVNGNPAVESNYLNDPAKQSSLRSGLAVPLEGLEGVVGVVALYHVSPDAFSKDHLRILLAISSKLALTIENALRFQVAKESATIDFLTQLPNARSLFLHLDSELARCWRSDTQLAVLVCDLNGFKEVNDRFGHLEGNRVLRTLAESFKKSCRKYDYVARMGGDEFIVVVAEPNPETLQGVVDRLQQVAFDVGGEICAGNHLSLSVGHALYPEDGTDAEKLLAEADRRMYAAKRQHYAGLKQELRRVAARAEIQVT